MRLPNAGAAIAAGVIGFREHGHPITVQINDSSMPRIGRISVRAFLFAGSSLSREAALVGGVFAWAIASVKSAFSGGPDFFEPNLVCFHLLLWAEREGLHALQNTNQLVHILVPQIEFSEGVHFHDSRFLHRRVGRDSDHIAHRRRRVRVGLACYSQTS